MKNILLLLLCLFFSACANTPSLVAQNDFDAGPKINLDVLTVTVLDQTPPLLGTVTPYNTNNFTPTIANALRHWAMDKIVATGTTGEAIFVIHEASLKSESIPHKDDPWKRVQSSKYSSRAMIELNVMRGSTRGQVTAEASQFVTLPEDPTALERNNAYNQLLNNLMGEITMNMRKGVHDHLSGFVVGVK